MHRAVLALLLAVSLLLAGCTSGGQGPTSATETPTRSSTTGAVGTTPGPSSPIASPNGSSPTATASPEPASVEYVVRAGQIPDEIAEVTATLRVVFADDPADLGPCYPDVFSGPYKPTLTALPTPAGGCHASERVTVNVTALDGEQSLGTFTAPGSASGHALIATEIVATYENGTTAAVYETGGDELVERPDATDGRYGIELGIEPARNDVAYDYWFVSEQFDPAA